MPNYDHLSDEELEKIAAGSNPAEPPAQAPDKYAHLSDDDLAKIAGNGEPKYHPAVSAVLGVGQGLANNWADEGIAALKTLPTAVNPMNYGEGYLNKVGSAYNKNQAEEQKIFDDAEKQNPGASLGGALAGSYLNPVNDAKRLYGAVTGAIQGAGQSKAHPLESPEQMSQFALDTASGAGFGALGTLGSKAIGTVAKKLAPTQLLKGAYERAVKSGMGQNFKEWKDLYRRKAVENIGNKLLSGSEELGLDPVMKFGMKGSDVAGAAKKSIDSAWSKVTDIYKKVDTKTSGKSVTGFDVARDLLKTARTINSPHPDLKSMKSELVKQAKTISKVGDMSLEQAQKFKNQWKWDKTPGAPNNAFLGENGTNAIKAAYESAIGKSVIKNMDKTAFKTQRRAKEYYGALKKVADKEADQLAKSSSNRWSAPSDLAAKYGLGGLAGTASLGAYLTAPEDKRNKTALQGALVTAAAGGSNQLLNKVLRERGPSMVSVAAKRLADLGQKSEYIKQRLLKAFPVNKLGFGANPERAASYFLNNKLGGSEEN